MNRIVIRDCSHHYVLTPVRRDQPVLVFIHGWLLSHRHWLPLMDLLGKDFQCLAYDLRGFGDSRISPSPDQPFSPAAYAEDLGQLLDALNIQKAWLVGHSLGGAIALWAASLDPSRVVGVTCINSGGGIYLEEEFERFRSFGTQLVRWRFPGLGRLPFLAGLFSYFSAVRPLPLIWGKQRLLDFLRADASAAIGALLESTTEAEVHQLPHIVTQLNQPVFFLGGSGDTIIEPQYVRHLASFHALFQETGWNWRELPDCGHFAMLEYPDMVAEYVRSGLDYRPS